MALSLEAAQTAVATCKANGYTVAATVVDSAGVPKVVLAADGAAARPVQSSQRKAMTVIATGAPSAAAEVRAKSDPAFAAQMAADPKQFARAGAEPLMADGVIIGAIGVGGAPGGEKDDACAMAAVAGVKDRLR